MDLRWNLPCTYKLADDLIRDIEHLFRMSLDMDLHTSGWHMQDDSYIRNLRCIPVGIAAVRQYNLASKSKQDCRILFDTRNSDHRVMGCKMVAALLSGIQ